MYKKTFSILTFQLKDLDPDSVHKNKLFPKDFFVEIKLKSMCKCINSTSFEEKCGPCKKDLEDEEGSWSQIYKIMQVFSFVLIIF